MREAHRIPIIVVAALVMAAPGTARGAGAVDPQDFQQIERGHYLAIAGGCATCHTVRGGPEYAGGRSIETPFGRLVAPNITPDADTGIGAWSNDEFVNALTKGTGRNGRHLYPAMPYTYMTKTSNEDALAIRAYLATMPAVRHEVNPNQLSFPFNIRKTMAIWKALFFREGPFRPVPGQGPEWNRGAYLAEGLMHCGMCHTAKNVLGGDKTSQRLQGYRLQGWFAPNITNDHRRGLGSWSIDDIVDYMKTGHSRTTAATGLMSEVVSLASSKLNDADLRALARYLKDQPAGTQSPAAAPDAKVMAMGSKIYTDECAACHAPDGTGVSGAIPSLKGSGAVQSDDATSLMRVVLRGTRSVATDKAPSGLAMPAFGWLLTDEQAAAVITYVRNAWGNAAASVAASNVRRARAEFAQRKD
jgi:mono/diheme cytochrome c family protein